MEPTGPAASRLLGMRHQELGGQEWVRDTWAMVGSNHGLITCPMPQFPHCLLSGCEDRVSVTHTQHKVGHH